MVTVCLQILVALLTLVFGAAALRVHRHPAHATPERRSAWLLVAAAFLLSGANGLVTATTAAWGFAGGEGTLAMDVAWRLKFVGNDSRGLAMVGFATILVRRLLAGGPGGAPTLRRTLRPLLAWMLAGAALGWMGGLDESSHYVLVSVTSAFAVLLLLAALWLAVTRDAMDYLLWAALVAYTVRETIDVSLTSNFAWLHVPEVWVPHFGSFQALAVFTYLLMISCAARRLVLARRGAAVPSLFELGGRPGAERTAPPARSGLSRWGSSPPASHSHTPNSTGGHMPDQGCKCNGSDDEGCETVEGGGYRMRFYKGFVSVSSVSGVVEPLYVQKGRYDVPGGKNPSAKSLAELETPDGKKVKLRIDDEPRVWIDDPDRPGKRIMRGPIRQIVVHLGAQGGEPVVEPAEFADRVRVLQGKENVLRVEVRPYTEGTAEGGVMAASESGQAGSGGGAGAPPPAGGGSGDTWTINNAAVTCPWTCD